MFSTSASDDMRKLYMRIVCLFGLDPAQTTIEFGMRWSNWPIETFLNEYKYMKHIFELRMKDQIEERS